MYETCLKCHMVVGQLVANSFQTKQDSRGIRLDLLLTYLAKDREV